MITFLMVLLVLLCFLLYNLLLFRKVINPMREQIKVLDGVQSSMVNDVRFNNGEFTRRIELLSGAINKIKSEHSTNIRTNRNEITKLKSQVGRIRK